MPILSRLLTALFISIVPACLVAAPPQPGRWALHVPGRSVLVLDLRREPNGGWTGELVRPRHFEADPAFSLFSNVEGPAIVQPVAEGALEGDHLRLKVRNPSKGLVELVWTPIAKGGTLGFEGVPSPPPYLVPAGEKEEVANSWDKGRTYTAVPEWPDNPEMTAIFDADQADRSDLGSIDWSVVGPRDEARRQRTRSLLDLGKLRSGNDFYHAAFVFQHGSGPDDFLLAHTFALIAASRGRTDASWIAAATLDRYLQKVGQKQIFGTQFVTLSGGPTTQEPFDRALVSDALRQALGVPALKDQEKQRQRFEAELKGAKQ
ncbi:MAG TPA: hypothetical protein VHE36_07245 [Sphingomicrobium sp.]|jgi:hypothetical protein|nr:hypothetical protein [Sphingomicrobium sp.]